MAGDRSWSTRGLRLAVLVLMMLATIGAWEVFKGAAKFGGYAYADFADHWTCYDVKSGGRDGREDRDGHGANPRAAVRLSDQFFPTGVDAQVRHLRLLCTAAIKTLR